MTASESDYSSADDELNSCTSVLLGYASHQPTDDSFSRLGGTPTWLDPSRPPPARNASCRNCSSIMPLLLQLNSDLPERFPTHERRLYIWGCRRKACRRKDGSIRALRCVRTSGVRTQPPQKTTESFDEGGSEPDLGAALFTGLSSRTPFSTTASAPANPFATKTVPTSERIAKSSRTLSSDTLANTLAEKVHISASAPLTSSEPGDHRPWPTDPSSLPKPYPSYHIDAETECLHAPGFSSTAPSSSSVYKAYLDGEPQVVDGGVGAIKEDKTLYEDAHDKTFQHFADTVAQNPEQVLRYEFGGQPLLYSRTDAVGRTLRASRQADSKVNTVNNGGRIPVCPYCGGARIFELQLTPCLIAELEAEESAATGLNEGMEWGTLLLGVCENDCCDETRRQVVQWREEWVGVQWEEVVNRGAWVKANGTTRCG